MAFLHVHLHKYRKREGKASGKCWKNMKEHDRTDVGDLLSIETNYITLIN